MNSIRERIVRYDRVFKVIHFIYTPIRIIKEYVRRYNLGKNYLHGILPAFNRYTKHFWLMGTPVHTNLGDQAQTYCLIKWINENYSMHKLYSMNTDVALDVGFQKWLQMNIGPDDIIAFQSGYCTQEKHLDHRMHMQIVKMFTKNRIVFFPQTVNLTTKRGIKKVSDIYQKHNRLLFLTRDHISLGKAKEYFPKVRIECFPDVVTTLIGSFVHTEVKRQGVLICVRNDSEKFYLDDEISYLEEELKKVSTRIEKTDTNSQYSLSETINSIEDILKETINRFASFETVITDRYHGTIFSMISDTPVIVIKTNDHKVITGVDWFDGIYSDYSVCKAETLEEAIKLTSDRIKNKVKISNNFSFSTEYYDKLREYIEQL